MSETAQLTIVRPHNCRPARRKKVYGGAVVTFDGNYPVTTEKTAIEFQEELHGKGMRVFNKCGKEGGKTSRTYRCTVCGGEITI